MTIDHPDSWYAASARIPPSRPRLRGERNADVCVVGGGYTGLSAALHLAERGYDVVLLEAARVGFGASGRNGGQVGSGQRQDVLELEARYGRDRTRALWSLAEEAKALLRERVERHRIECDWKPGNLLAVTRRRYLPELERETEHLAAHYAYRELRMLNRDEVREMVASESYCGGQFDSGGAHLHPLKLALGLARAAIEAGACLHEESRVIRIRWDRRPLVCTGEGQVRARWVLLCGNAYLGALVPGIRSRIMPIANHVLATEPLGAARAAALIPADCCVHASKFVVDYYRLSPDGRLIFGGGETYRDRPLPDLRAFVRRYMVKVFPQLSDVGIEYAWSGRLAITRSRLPHFGRIRDHAFFAQGFSGHGVALAPFAGKLLAEAVAGSAERFDVFAGLPHRRFPGGEWARQPLLAAGMLYYALKDRL